MSGFQVMDFNMLDLVAPLTDIGIAMSTDGNDNLEITLPAENK